MKRLLSIASKILHWSYDLQSVPPFFTPTRTRLLSILCAPFALLMLYFASTAGNRVPNESVLIQTTGIIVEARTYKKQFFFKLKGDNVRYSVDSKIGAFNRFKKHALVGSKIQMRHEPLVREFYHFIPNDESISWVYEASINGDLILSFQDALKASKSDDELGYILAAVFILIGLYLWGFARFRDQHQQE